MLVNTYLWYDADMLDAALILPGMTITASEMGKRGMRSRLKKMTPEDRKALASKAGKARWEGVSKEDRIAFAKKIRKGKKKRKGGK